MNELWLFVVHNGGRTWTRAAVPSGIQTARDLIDYLRRGGRVVSAWMDIPERARFSARVIGMTVLARIVE